MNTVPCLTWVRRGAAKETPDRVELSPDDLGEMLQGKVGQTDEDEESQGNENVQPGPSGSAAAGDMDVDDIDAKYGLDNYDDDAMGNSDEEGGTGLDIGNIAFYSSRKDDPYLSKNIALDSDEEDDVRIKPTDTLVTIGRVKQGYCNLEVYVYEEDDDNLYCHHDVLLPSFPLCMEWIDFDPGSDSPGNLVAVGSMEPTIELWDLDVMDSLEPAFTLGAPSKKSKKKNKKEKKAAAASHTDAVLDIAWNRHTKHVLASASADHTVGLWDITKGEVVGLIKQHHDKVQTLQWHPVETTGLLSGSFDHTILAHDCRNFEQAYRSWKTSGEVERVVWNHHNPCYFFASTDTGDVYYYDVRTTEPVFTYKAHSQAVSGLSLSSSVPGCLLTSSPDNTVKVWDVRGDSPDMVWKKDFKMGEIHCSSFCPDSALVVAVGGERELRVVNLLKTGKVSRHFGVEGAPAEDVETSGAVGDQEEDDDAMVVIPPVKADKPKKKKKKNKGKKTSH